MIHLSTTTSNITSRQEISIDMVLDRGIFENNRITLLNITFIPTTGIVLQ